MQTNLNCIKKVSSDTDGFSVKKKGEMFLRKTAAFAGVFTDLTFEVILACHLKPQILGFNLLILHYL